MAEDQHKPPVTAELYAHHGRENPNIKIVKAGVFPILAPADGFVEKIIKNTDGSADSVIFRHEKEPYYSILSNGDNLVITLEIGQKVVSGVLMGTVDNKISWRVGAIGNKTDWLDPDEWIKGNFLVWGAAKEVKKLETSKAGLQDLILYGGIAYLISKMMEK